jgi:hypothetical protein
LTTTKSCTIKSALATAALILETFLKKLKNQGFREYLLRSGFRDQDYSEWSKFIKQRALEFNETKLAAKMMGISLLEGKPSYPKSSERFHRHQSSRELSVAKEARNQVHRGSPGEGPLKCYGCGHVTTPPHRKKDCPHKDRPGWGAPSVMTRPLLLVAMSCENVAIFDVFIEGLGAKVGLDSMSSSSLISSQLVERLPVRRYKGPRLLLSPAGDGRAIEVEEFVIQLKLLHFSNERLHLPHQPIIHQRLQVSFRNCPTINYVYNLIQLIYIGYTSLFLPVCLLPVISCLEQEAFMPAKMSGACESH